MVPGLACDPEVLWVGLYSRGCGAFLGSLRWAPARGNTLA